MGKVPLEMKANGGNHWLVAGLLLFFCACFPARANVYATDIYVNGSLQAGVVLPGTNVAISYILNDNATNVSVRIYSGASVVKTFTSDNGGAGTNAGLNTITWTNASLADGAYHLSITASVAGYDDWTNITDDGTNFDVFFPTSITVNKNTNSPYYGRVFVGNASGPEQGLLKYNADGSAADEGGFSTGGYGWEPPPMGDAFPVPSPWKMSVGSDDRLYVEDWYNQGVVMSFDQVISTNYLSVLTPENYPYPNVDLSGLCVSGQGTNMQLFMADINTTNALPDAGLGIISWNLNSNGVTATNDLGTVDVTLTNNSDLNLSPYAVTVDAYGNIYTIQRTQDGTLSDALADTNARVLCFPPAPSGGPPDTAATWEIGSGSPWLANCYGVAVNQPATFAAVAARGWGCSTCGDELQDGGLSILTAAHGSLITNITTDIEGDTNQEFFDVAWDNVGNLYTVYGADGFEYEGWRVYSPPGPNQATTVAVPVIQMYHVLTPPRLSAPVLACMGQLNFTLTGQSNMTYVIQQSPDLVNWTPVATNFSPVSVQTVSVFPPDNQDFYRAVAAP